MVSGRLAALAGRVAALVLRLFGAFDLLPHCRPLVKLVFSRFISGLFRALFAMKEIWNGKEMHS